MPDRLAGGACVGLGEALLLEQDLQLDQLEVAVVDRLGALVGDLACDQLVLGMAGEVGAGAHGERARGRFRDSADDDRRRTDRGAGQPCDHAERNEEPVLEPEHELPDSHELREPPPLGDRVVAQRPHVSWMSSRITAARKSGDSPSTHSSERPCKPTSLHQRANRSRSAQSHRRKRPAQMPPHFAYQYDSTYRGWLIAPTQVQHPIRGSFLDPRGLPHRA